MTPAQYVDCACGKRVQADAAGKARPHAVPIPSRADPRKAERCRATSPKETRKK